MKSPIFIFLLFFSLPSAFSANVDSIANIQKACSGISQDDAEKLREEEMNLLQVISGNKIWFTLNEDRSRYPAFLESYEKTLQKFKCTETYQTNATKLYSNIDWKKNYITKTKNELTWLDKKNIPDSHILFSIDLFFESNKIFPIIDIKKEDILPNEEWERLKNKFQKLNQERAKTCSEKMVSNEVVNMNTTRNQQDMQWCYANAVADALGLETGRRLSSVHIALIYGEANEYTTNQLYNDGGKTWDTLIDLRGKEVCLEKDIPGNKLNMDMIGKLDKAWDNIKDSDNKSWPCENASGLAELEGFFGLNKEEWRKILVESAREDILKNFTKNYCPEKVKLGAYYVEFNSDHPIADTVDEALEKNKMAIITYQSSFLYTKNQVVSRHDDAHISGIVGRRFNAENGDCEYLIRNSWGDCSDKYARECEKGHIWLPQAELERAAWNAVYIGPAK